MRARCVLAAPTSSRSWCRFAVSNERVLMPYVYGVLESAREHGWNVMLLTGADGISEIDRVVRSKMVDGLSSWRSKP